VQTSSSSARGARASAPSDRLYGSRNECSGHRSQNIEGFRTRDRETGTRPAEGKIKGARCGPVGELNKGGNSRAFGAFTNLRRKLARAVCVRSDQRQDAIQCLERESD